MVLFSNEGAYLKAIWETSAINSTSVNTFKQLVENNTGDWLIDLSLVSKTEESALAEFSKCLVSLMEEQLCLLVAQEDDLQKLGLSELEIPCTATVNEAIDYLFMLQLEQELGAEE